jgi:hypothetical protein
METCQVGQVKGIPLTGNDDRRFIMFRSLGCTAIILCVLLTGSAVIVPEAAAAPAPAASPALPAKLQPVQIFDVSAGKVVRTLDNSPQFQAIARQWLSDVQGMSPNFMPDDRCGYVFRIPLESKQLVQMERLTLNIQEVFLFYCRGREPELLAFDKRNKPYLLRVNTDLGPFLTLAGLEP